MMQQDGGKLLGFVLFSGKKYKDRLSAREGENKCVLRQDDTEAESEQMYRGRMLFAYGSGIPCMTRR